MTERFCPACGRHTPAMRCPKCNYVTHVVPAFDEGAYE